MHHDRAGRTFQLQQLSTLRRQQRPHDRHQLYLSQRNRLRRPFRGRPRQLTTATQYPTVLRRPGVTGLFKTSHDSWGFHVHNSTLTGSTFCSNYQTSTGFLFPSGLASFGPVGRFCLGAIALGLDAPKGIKQMPKTSIVLTIALLIQRQSATAGSIQAVHVEKVLHDAIKVGDSASRSPQREVPQSWICTRWSSNTSNHNRS